MDTESRNGRQTSPWATCLGGFADQRPRGGGAPPGALRGTRSDGPRKARSAVVLRPATSGRPCSPQCQAANNPASAGVDGRGRRFRLGGGSTWLLACPPVLRLVRSCGPPGFGDPKGRILRTPSAIGFSAAIVDDAAAPMGTLPRVLNCCFGVSMSKTLESLPRGGQPFGNAVMSRGVSACLGTYPGHRMPSPTGWRNAPAASRWAAPQYSASRLPSRSSVCSMSLGAGIFLGIEIEGGHRYP